jgi:hypothetical protein
VSSHSCFVYRSNLFFRFVIISLCSQYIIMTLFLSSHAFHDACSGWDISLNECTFSTRLKLGFALAAGSRWPPRRSSVWVLAHHDAVSTLGGVRFWRGGLEQHERQSSEDIYIFAYKYSVEVEPSNRFKWALNFMIRHSCACHCLGALIFTLLLLPNHNDLCSAHLSHSVFFVCGLVNFTWKNGNTGYC